MIFADNETLGTTNLLKIRFKIDVNYQLNFEVMPLLPHIFTVDF